MGPRGTVSGPGVPDPLFRGPSLVAPTLQSFRLFCESDGTNFRSGPCLMPVYTSHANQSRFQNYYDSRTLVYRREANPQAHQGVAAFGAADRAQSGIPEAGVLASTAVAVEHESAGLVAELCSSSNWTRTGLELEYAIGLVRKITSMPAPRMETNAETSLPGFMLTTSQELSCSISPAINQSIIDFRAGPDSAVAHQDCTRTQVSQPIGNFYRNTHPIAGKYGLGPRGDSSS
jgi:hypothetical protein